jgi:hypothetical protein
MDVAPACLGWMRSLAIELDGNTELPIEVVQVPGTRTRLAECLARGAGQSMGSLNTSHVPGFQRSMNACGGIGRGRGQLGTPPELRPGRHD